MIDVTVPLLGNSVRVISAFPNYGTANLVYTGQLVLYAIAYQNSNLKLGVYGELPVPVLRAVGGAQTKKLKLPSLTITASGTTTVIGAVAAVLPSLTFIASGTVTQTGEAQLVYSGDYSLIAQGGAIAKMQLSNFRAQLIARGSAGSVGSVSTGGIYLPSLQLVASGTKYGTGKLIANLPSFKFAPSGAMRAGVHFPSLTLYARGGSAVTAAYEAYSVSLFRENAGEEKAYVTHYTDYPFEQIIRFGLKYFGVSKDGLFELTGDRFDDRPIIAFIRTGETDGGIRQVKRPISLYVAGRLGGDFVAAVTPSELKDYEYHYHTFDKTGARNYRVLFGKGLRARYLAYTFTNPNGEAFDLDEITPEVAELRRTA